MLDTLLGENDGAPFRVGEEAITGDRVFEGAAIPQFFQAFDSLSDPRVMSQGTLRGDDATVPDAVYFSNWGRWPTGRGNSIFNLEGNFLRAGEFELDSAVALYWYPQLLAPGEERVYTDVLRPWRHHHRGRGPLPRVDVARPGIGRPQEPVALARGGVHRELRRRNGPGCEARRCGRPRVCSWRRRSGPAVVGHLGVGDTAQASWTVHVTPGASGDFTYEVVVQSPLRTQTGPAARCTSSLPVS